MDLIQPLTSTLRATRERNLLNRKKKIVRLEIPLLRQTTDFTCGACATLMVWKYFDKGVELSRRNEFLVWSETVALPFKFSSPYRISAFFIKRGFGTKLLMERSMSGESRVPLECCLVDDADRQFFLDFFQSYNKKLERQIANAIEYRKPRVSDIRRALSGRNPVIALVDSYYTVKARGARNPTHLPHWVVLTGFEDRGFHINDSIYEKGLKPGDIMMSKRVLGKAMDTRSRFGWPSALILVGRVTG